MAINKVVYDGTTLIDLSSDTLSSANQLAQGIVAHDRTGATVTGTIVIPTGNVNITQAGQTDVTQYATATVPLAEYITGVDHEYYTDNNVRKWHFRGKTELDTSEGDVEGWIGNGTQYSEYVDYNAVPANTSVTPTESAQTIGGARYMMEGAVTVNAISSTYVGTGITRRSSIDLTASGATVTVPSGYYSAQASASVSTGTAGTPTATKGTVSNHSVSVTPSVTNTTGYIVGSTKTGTAVTVTASELASGNKEITANGTNIDVVGYSTVSVNVSGGGSTSNVVEGTFTASTTKGQAQTVNIPYTGNGYPIFAHIEVDGGMGNPDNTAWYTTVQKYAVGLWCMSKRLQSTSPDYSDNTEKNQSIVMVSHKNNASNAAAFTVGGGATANIFTTSAANALSATCIRFSSKNTMSVFVASTSYGLMSGVTYRYQIQYSS